jgi:gephyrin
MTRRTSAYDILPVSDALNIVLAYSKTLAPVKITLAEADGFLLAQDVFAKDPLPPFRASIMDGYAVIAEDGPGDYPVAMEVMAGGYPTSTLESKSICRVTTGAPVPDGANAVIKVEDTLLLPEKTVQNQEIVRIEKKCTVGQDIRPIGSDVAIGQLVLSKGTLLRAAEIGILATVGAWTIEVFPTPKVAVLSTGDELVDPSQAHYDATGSEKLKQGLIRDSNRHMLLAALKERRVNVLDLGISSDHLDQLEAKIKTGLEEADVLITSGGVSMGELDLMKPILEKFGTVHFGRVLMKPGKPLTFATVDPSKLDGSKTQSTSPKLVFGLPGNPVSSLVTFTLFVIPSLKKIAGHTEPHHKVVQAKTTMEVRLDSTRPEYHRCTLLWDLEQSCFLATSTGRQISSRLLSMVSANAFLVVPQGEGKLSAGSLVNALLLDY